MLPICELTGSMECPGFSTGAKFEVSLSLVLGAMTVRRSVIPSLSRRHAELLPSSKISCLDVRALPG
ncbi:hypothetical protein Pelo_18912 [Pelomyxa schiedti]|nr:hypothetical protein Pelo_18912 [Pelomyxa schiedti]